ncbi:MAG: translocation/assembly module TamB domain-containing protein [Bryobacterales bacterium]|nr:translocation/assembly module TamB domain-containing protein [Bryobacterales bacterium]
MIKAALTSILRHRIALAATAFIGLGWGGFEAAIRTDWFLDTLRHRAIAKLEQSLGETVSIDEIRLGDSRLAFEIKGLELRASDDAAAAPLLSVPHAAATLGWRSLLGGVTVLESLSLRDPVFNVTVAEDGPAILGQASQESLISGLAVRRFELDGGQLVWNGRPYDLEFRGTGLRVETRFDPRSQRHTIDAELRDPQVGSADSLALIGSTVSMSAVADTTGVEITSAEVHGQDLSAQLRGTIRGRQQLSARCVFSLQSTIAPLADLIGYAGLGLLGSLAASGELEWDGASGAVAYSGGFAASSVGSSALELDLSVAGRFFGNESSVELADLEGAALGGGLQAQATIDAPWLEPRLTSNGSVSGIALANVATAMGSTVPAWSGSVDAEFDLSGTAPHDLLANVRLQVAPTEEPSTLPVGGDASLHFSSATGRVSVDGFSLATPNIRASGSGGFAVAGGGELLVEVEIDSKQALERILAVLRIVSQLPPTAPDGRYSYRGSLDWGPEQIASATLSGDFSIEEFTLGGQRWDHLALQGVLFPDRIDVMEGRMVDGAGDLRFSGSLPLQEHGALDLAISATAIDARKLALASGFALPIEGLLAMEASLSGTQSEPVAASSVIVDMPTFFGERFDGLEAEVYYDPNGFELRNASLERGQSRLTVTASTSGRTEEARFSMESNSWPLEEFTWARALAPGVTGALRFDLRAAGPPTLRGSLGSLELSGTWEVSDLRRRGLELGNWSGSVSSALDAENIQLDWQADVFDGTFRGDATLQRQLGPSSYNGSVQFDSLSTQRLAEFLDLPSGTPLGTLMGSADFGGVVGSAGTFVMDGTIERAEVSLPSPDGEPHVISNVFPLRWGIRDGDLRFDSMALTGPDTDFRIDGAVGLEGERSLDVSIDGDVDLSLLDGFADGIQTVGTTRIGVRIRGTLDDPSLEGSVELVDASISSVGLPLQLSNLNGAIAFQGGQGRISRLTATSGGGTVQFSGVTSFRDSEFEYRLQASASDVRLNYPPSVASVIDGDFVWAGAGGRSILNGNIVITRMSTASDLSFADLFSSLQVSGGSLDSSPLLEGLQLNVHVGAVQQLPIETSLVRDVQADFDLDFVGTLANPSLVGAIQIVQGELRMLGTHYQINRGEIRFIDALQAEPVLNVELETRIRDVDLALVLSGPGRNLDLSYRSDPPLPFHDLVDLVAVGKEPTIDPSIASRRRIEQQSLVQTGADNILSQAIARPVSKRLQRFFGVSRLKVDPQVGGLESNPTARLSTEQQIADDITLIYSYDLSSAQQQAIRLEWNPDRNWSFIMTRDQNGLLGSDVLYKLRLR